MRDALITRPGHSYISRAFGIWARGMHIEGSRALRLTRLRPNWESSRSYGWSHVISPPPRATYVVPLGDRGEGWMYAERLAHERSIGFSGALAYHMETRASLSLPLIALSLARSLCCSSRDSHNAIASSGIPRCSTGEYRGMVMLGNGLVALQRRRSRHLGEGLGDPMRWELDR